MTKLSVPCTECTEAESQDLLRAQQEHGLKMLERGPLKALFEFQQPKLIGLVVYNEMDQFIVPREWVRLWVNWAKDKQLGSKKVRPAKLDNRLFLCEHAKLAIDVETEVKAPKQIALVSEEAWSCLVER